MELFLFSCTKEVAKENPLLLGDNKDSITEEVAKSVALNFVTGVNMNSGGNELEMIVNIKP